MSDTGGGFLPAVLSGVGFAGVFLVASSLAIGWRKARRRLGIGLFLTVVAYRDMGLYYDARDALDSVERDSSLSWELYRLKGEILAELGHEEEARRAFDRADELTR